MKIKLVAVIIAIGLVGCASPSRPPPIDVQLIPNDCANQRLIIGYLTQESQRPRGNFESEKDYDRYRSEMRNRVWLMRYYCQPV